MRSHPTPAFSTAALALGLLVSACSDSQAPRTVTGSAVPRGGAPEATGGTEAVMTEWLDRANQRLEAQGLGYRAAMAEWLTEGEEAGSTVFFANVGNKQLSAHFVPGDPRRLGPGAGDEITFLVDVSDGFTMSGLSGAETEGAIDRAMATWQNAGCTGIRIVKAPDPGFDPDIVDGLFGFGGLGTPAAQVTHAGWIGGVFPPPVLAVTVTLIFTDENDNPTDIDNNGLFDAALREIYYNQDFMWRLDRNIDVETVALHEAGHGLSQAHFGTLFRTEANGKFHFSPRSVMNAGYTGVQQDLAGTDLAGHCSIWGSWPN